MPRHFPKLNISEVDEQVRLLAEKVVTGVGHSTCFFLDENYILALRSLFQRAHPVLLFLNGKPKQQHPVELG